VIRANSSERPAYAKLTMCLSRAVNYPGQLLGASCGPCSSHAPSGTLASSLERPYAQPTMGFSRAVNDLDQLDLQLRAVNASAWSNWSMRWDRRDACSVFASKTRVTLEDCTRKKDLDSVQGDTDSMNGMISMNADQLGLRGMYTYSKIAVL
jgi:hypothetical protein